MNTRWLKYLLFALILSLPFSGCREEELISPDYIGEGMARISATVEFEPLRAALDGKTRAPGNAIKDITKLAVVVYKPDGELFRIWNRVTINQREQINNNKPGDYSGTAAESATYRVTFDFPEILPYGRYNIYVVANLEDDITEEMASKPEVLKGQSIKWTFGDDMSKNAQMFGFMTQTGDGNETSMGFDAPVITINKQDVNLHSWLKRLASKVTISYDGSGLNQDVWVYIHNVSLRQIPLECKLGENNTPTKDTEVTEDDFGTPGDPVNVASEDADKKFGSGQYFYYDRNGLTESTGQKDLFPNENQYDQWLMIANGLPEQGSALMKTDGSSREMHSHLESDPALYFYENMQNANLPEGFKKDESYNKTPKHPDSDDPDKAGQNVIPGMDDYKDRVKCGTFIEVEAYYVSAPTNPELASHKSDGPIKYRFMLGQDDSFDYDAIRNHHYKLTLGFNGWANEPDWHIEYYEDAPEIVATEMYMPYLYNQSAEFPIRLNGNVTRMEMQIIENNWGPYDPGNKVTYNGIEISDVPAQQVGDYNPEYNFEHRITQFRWNLPVYANKNGFNENEPNPRNTANENNYLYGLHKMTYCHLKENDKGEIEEDPTKPYYVTPIWVGFLRLQQPTENLDMTIFGEEYGGQSYRYDDAHAREGLKNYYFGMGGAGKWINGNASQPGGSNDLSYRAFEPTDLTPGDHKEKGINNSWSVENVETDGVKGKVVNVKLWTQPKTMMDISGFSGNNPYEAYNRKAVIRITAWFEGHEKPLMRDVPIIQARRLVNPKGIWRSTSASNSYFNFTLYDNQQATTTDFNPLQSRGSWSAKVIHHSGGTISITPWGGSFSATDGKADVEGKTESNVTFKINFPGIESYALIEILYHGKSAKHLVLCRQGYSEPVQIVQGGAKWSSYALFSCDEAVPFGAEDTDNQHYKATLTKSPLALGTLFKKGNYNEGVLISNLTTYGPRVAPKQGPMELSTNGTNNKPLKKSWWDIPGIARRDFTNYNGNRAPVVPNGFSATAENVTKVSLPAGVTYVNYSTKNEDEIEGTYNCATWRWAKFDAIDKDGHTDYYRVPTYEDFSDLLNADVAVGVLYGDAATEPKNNTLDAYGYFDPSNSAVPENADRGMRGVFVYNSSDAKNVFFPVGTSGYARRTIQGFTATTWKDGGGEMRYSGYAGVLSQVGNSMRPIPYNMENVQGAIYWMAQEHDAYYPGWEMNIFDLNFNKFDYPLSFGPYGDAVPIKLVKDDGSGKPLPPPPPSSRSKSSRSSKSRRR